jgi:hypothetical protein
MPGTLSRKGVRNFMQQRIAHRLLRIFPYKMRRQLNPSLLIPAQSQRPLSPVPPERPIPDAVLMHQHPRQLLRLLKIHDFRIP